jgi:endonuclease YncB( thermonuclease family)
MRIHPRLSSYLAIFAFTLVIGQQASATTLTGRVIEINDGDEITILNLNRPVRIKLIGIDAPEKDQAFGAIAKQHLSDLVSDKVVSVEYSGIGQHSILIGLVLLNQTDISAQMIRDGAAWFDPNTSHLSNTQREVYFQSEQAARKEKRGLWQVEGAVAPWEFVKAEEEKRHPVAQPRSVSEGQPQERNRPTPELTSLNLLRTGTSMPRPQAGQFIESSDMTWATDGPFRKTWRRFSPAGENFSALLPGDGEQASKTINFGDRSFDVSYYRTRDGHTMFELVWFTGPSFGESDSVAIQSGLNSILQGVGLSVEATGRSFQCEPKSSSDISSGVYSGTEFDLSGCTLPGMARVYTKVVGDQRQYYLGFTFYKQEDDNVQKFLKSFVMLAPKKGSSKTSLAK